MYSGILMSTSSLYQTYPYTRNQNSNMNTPVPPGFAPIQPGFGENQYENLYGQPHPAMNPGYEEHQTYPMHQTPSQGFGFQQGQVTDEAPFYHQGFRYHQYSVQQQVMTYPVTQPAGQAQPAQQVQVERNAQEHVLIVELERPVYPMSKPRLRWTPELHERFTRAAEELGGYFKATPKGILKKMNVRGITRDQLKSHLQKVRNRVLQTTALEEILGHEIQASSAIVPKFEPRIGEHERMLRSFETPNHHRNHRIAPAEDPVNNFNFEDFDCAPISQTPNYHQNLRSALCDDHAYKDIKFEDSDFY